MRQRRSSVWPEFGKRCRAAAAGLRAPTGRGRGPGGSSPRPRAGPAPEDLPRRRPARAPPQADSCPAWATPAPRGLLPRAPSPRGSSTCPSPTLGAQQGRGCGRSLLWSFSFPSLPPTSAFPVSAGGGWAVIDNRAAGARGGPDRAHRIGRKCEGGGGGEPPGAGRAGSWVGDPGGRNAQEAAPAPLPPPPPAPATCAPPRPRPSPGKAEARPCSGKGEFPSRRALCLREP